MQNKTQNTSPALSTLGNALPPLAEEMAEMLAHGDEQTRAEENARFQASPLTQKEKAENFRDLMEDFGIDGEIEGETVTLSKRSGGEFKFNLNSIAGWFGLALDVAGQFHFTETEKENLKTDFGFYAW